MAFKPGDQLCSCTLLQKCGDGAYGEVWLADDSIGARVALKIIHNRGSYSERELNGLKNYRDCNHPNLLKIRYVEITDDRICCIMDAADDLNRGAGKYVPDTLANRLNKFGRMDGLEILAMLDGLLAGLEDLHRNGLVHRDIKPDNIIWVNGRPTLADAGLITHEGKGSLVGTPGFMSPKLMSGKGPADSGDDFYALGKVIYCALTGLPVGEYPSIPENMTISVDASLGRAFRESCKRPIRSSAEFRSLLQRKISTAQEPGKEEKLPANRLLKTLLLILSALLLTVLFAEFYLLWRPETAVEKANPRNELDPGRKEAIELDRKLEKPRKRSAETEAKMEKLRNADSYAKQDLQERTSALLRKIGFLPGNGNLAAVLVNYDIMTQSEICDLLMSSNRDPRLLSTAGVHPKTVKPVTQLEYDLKQMILQKYNDFDSKQVKKRQDYWCRQTGTPQEIQRKMLKTDPLMQALSLDAVIRNGINSILRNGKFQGTEQAELEEFLQFRFELLEQIRSR